MFTKRQTNIIKGIAVVLLMIHHSWSPLKTETMPVYGEAIRAATSLGKMSVAVFALLSGYGMYLSAIGKKAEDLSVWRHILSHIMKIYTVFWLTAGILIAAVSIWVGGPGGIYGKLPVYRMILDIIGLSYIAGTPMLASSWWYVTAALLYYCCFPFLMGGIRKLKKGNYILWLMLSVWLFLHPGQSTVMVYGMFFAMGMILGERDLLCRLLKAARKGWVRAVFILFMAAGLAGSLAVRQIFLAGLKAEYYLDWLPALLIIMLTAVLTADLPWKFPGILELAGRVSFEMFLIHGCFIKYAPFLVYPDDKALFVLLRIFGLSLIGGLAIRLITRIIRLDALPGAVAGSRSVSSAAGPALALLVAALMLPGMIANLGIGELQLYPRQAVLETGDWYAPVYLKTPLLWEFAVPKYTSSNPAVAYMEDGVIYAQSPGTAKFTVSTAGGTFGSISVIVNEKSKDR